jgi:hypothetical protein
MPVDDAAGCTVAGSGSACAGDDRFGSGSSGFRFFPDCLIAHGFVIRRRRHTSVRDGLRAVAVEYHCLRLLLFLAGQQHPFGDDFTVVGRSIEEDRYNEYHEDDEHYGADNAFFQSTFHHDSGREYSLSCSSTGPTI